MGLSSESPFAVSKGAEEDGWVVLKAANRKYKTQRFEAERVQPLGILVGLHRSYEK